MCYACNLARNTWPPLLLPYFVRQRLLSTRGFLELRDDRVSALVAFLLQLSLACAFCNTEYPHGPGGAGIVQRVLHA